MKPGIKSTEFWLVALTGLINFAGQSGILPATFDTASTITALGSAIGLVAYIFSRGWVKKNNGG